mmetsp:Transcript_112687/g.318420  ORF Transcript_112687/g.318420 Transcript_112687/m.318420 type:complete len:200 (+) Transcript_112687:730-1329(+)
MLASGGQARTRSTISGGRVRSRTPPDRPCSDTDNKLPLDHLRPSCTGCKSPGLRRSLSTLLAAGRNLRSASPRRVRTSPARLRCLRRRSRAILDCRSAARSRSASAPPLASESATATASTSTLVFVRASGTPLASASAMAKAAPLALVSGWATAPPLAPVSVTAKAAPLAPASGPSWAASLSALASAATSSETVSPLSS